MGRWKKPTHSQVVGAVAAIPGLLFLTTRKFLPVSDDCEHDGDCINVHARRKGKGTESTSAVGRRWESLSSEGELPAENSLNLSLSFVQRRRPWLSF